MGRRKGWTNHYANISVSSLSSCGLWGRERICSTLASFLDVGAAGAEERVDISAHMVRSIQPGRFSFW